MLLDYSYVCADMQDFHTILLPNIKDYTLPTLLTNSCKGDQYTINLLLADGDDPVSCCLTKLWFLSVFRG